MTAPGAFTSGDVLTAADMNDLPAGVLGYDDYSAPVTVTTSDNDLLSVTFTVASTRRIVIMMFLPQVGNPSISNEIIAGIYQAPSGTTRLNNVYTTLYSADYTDVSVVWIGQYSAGTHTAYGSVRTSAGTATISMASNRRSNLIVYDGGNV